MLLFCPSWYCTTIFCINGFTSLCKNFFTYLSFFSKSFLMPCASFWMLDGTFLSKWNVRILLVLWYWNNDQDNESRASCVAYLNVIVCWRYMERRTQTASTGESAEVAGAMCHTTWLWKYRTPLKTGAEGAREIAGGTSMPICQWRRWLPCMIMIPRSFHQMLMPR